MSFTILVTAPKLVTAGVDRLDAAGCRTLYVSKQGGEAELVRLLRLGTSQSMGSSSRILPLSKAAIESCGTLRVISRHGVGYNNVDVAAATAHGIPVLIAPATNGQSVAELTIGLLLAVARSIPAHDGAIRQRNWDRSGSGLQLGGRTLGVVGFGGMGRAVCRAALGLGMRVVAFDEYMRPDSSSA